MSGDGDAPEPMLNSSEAALQTAIALWCNAIARWYAAVLSGRPNVRSACLALLGGRTLCVGGHEHGPALGTPFGPKHQGFGPLFAWCCQILLLGSD